jgi:hypothetical protein
MVRGVMKLTDRLQPPLARARAATIPLARQLPWIGWVAWDIVVAIAIAGIFPRRLSSTFATYLDAAERLWTGGRVYNPLTLGDFLYFPIALLVHVPLIELDLVWASPY